MIDLVDETLRHWRQVPFEWGQADCMLSVGEYVAQRGGIDLTERFRGTYHTALGAHRHLRDNGGISGLFDQMGLEQIDGAPIRGDVVELATSDGHSVGAICTGSGIAARMTTGTVEVEARLVQILGVWRCPL